MKEARDLEQAEKYHEASLTYKEAYSTFTDSPESSNSILDRIDLFNSNATNNPAALKVYLRARDLFDQGKRAEAAPILKKLSTDPKSLEVQDNALFLLAAIDYFSNDYPKAIKQFNSLITTHPYSEKLATANFMIGKAYYHSGESFDAYNDEAAKKNAKTDPAYLNLKKAITALNKAIQQDPDGLLTPEYYGWKGGVYHLNDMPIESLKAFSKAYMLSKDEKDRWLKEAGYAFGIIRPAQEVAALDIVSADPDLMVSYLWYGIYHHNDQPERQLTLASGARKYLNQHPNIELAPSLTIRLAQTLYNGKSYAEAVEVASKVVSDKTVGDQALWMRAVSNAKLQNFNPAIDDLKKLVKDHAESNLVRGAIEELAIIYEQAGRPEDAVALYLEKNYLADARYVMDIMMSIEQMEKLAKREQLVQRDEVLYALGSKFMIDLNLAKAKEIFSQIKASPSQPKEGQAHDVGTEKQRILEVIAELDKLIDANNKATTDDEKASTLYAIGAYIYHKNNQNSNRHAIFNNVMIQGYDSPVYAYGKIFESEDKIRRARYDKANLLIRAEDYFKQVFTKYPKSSSAPKALYSAALTRLWLSAYHSYISYVDDQDPYSSAKNEAAAKKYLNQLIKSYPKSPLVADAKTTLTSLATAGNN